MAGAGKKTFVAGEVLTAAQVNDYLMDQAVMRFSGSAARAASITAPTEGMVTYLDDSNVLEYYDGSAWTPVVPQSEIDGKIPASLITASGQVIIGAANASVVALGGATEGQVLTAASAQPGGIGWVTPSGAGAAAWAYVSATSTDIPLSTTLLPGFYKISTSTTTTFTSAQFRFIDANGNLYGASLQSGAGTFSIPATVASINVTAGTAPFTVLVEEVPALTESLLAAPTVANLDLDGYISASFDASLDPSAINLGVFYNDTGSLAVYPASAISVKYLSTLSASQAVGDTATVTLVQQGNNGLWSLPTSASNIYPFIIYTSNDTFIPPAWAASVEVYVIAGGGAGGGDTSLPRTGGGGAGGVITFTEAVSGSVAVVVGAGGVGTTSRGPNGNDSSWGASVATGGGGGGSWSSNTTGTSGGSGGGPSEAVTAAGAAGIAGQGFDGAPSTSGVISGGGGGAGESGGTDATGEGGDGIFVFGSYVAGGGGGSSDNSNSLLPAGLGQSSYGGGGNSAAYWSSGVRSGPSGKDGAVLVRVIPA